MLDPGIQFLEMDKLKQDIPNSVGLLLESETVDTLAPQFKITYKNTEFATSAKEVGSHVLYSKVKRTGHVSFCDLSLMELMFFKISKMIPNTPKAKERLSHIIDLITLFMSIIVEKEFVKQILETQIESFNLANPEESFM